MGVLPRPLLELEDEARIRRALEIAALTPPGDVPVGAVVFAPDGRLLGWGVNRREADSDPTAHAEVLAIRQAVREFGDGWRLTGCTLAVTLEPCTMCTGAILGARLHRVVFGAYEPKTGACGSLIDVPRAPGQLHSLQVKGGVLETECAQLLGDFFKDFR
ncbi:nucleoside deaminase [Staphylococcus chromogenes]|nr:nucleoside deaminase [Staphylococcus chromogenes]